MSTAGGGSVHHNEPMSRATALLLLLSLLAGTVACTSAERSTTGPSGSRCTIRFTNSVEASPAAGGTGTLAIVLPRDCTWAVESRAAWVVITSATSGQGEASIAYRVAENTQSAPRSTTIDVNDVKATITQAAGECRYRVAPLTPAVDAASATLTVDVETSADCEWTAASDAAWIRLNAGATGKGHGAVTLAVDANGGPTRSGI